MSEESGEDLEREVERITRLLDQLIRISGTTKLALEKKMGWSAGYLSRLANGSIELRFRHILLVAKALGVSPAAFFHAAYPHVDSDEGELTGLLATLRSSHPEPPPAPPALPSMSEQELETRLANALVKLFGRFAQEAAPEGAAGGRGHEKG